MRQKLKYLIFLAFIACAYDVQYDVSGAYYDWTVTKQPEHPWMLDYNKTLVTKFFMCSRDGKGDFDTVYLDFEGALDVIRKLDNITLGIPKVVYLVGWQYNGHDSKYPSWAEVNNALKRPQDITALQSLRWLIGEARSYNTTVSLHLNMIDAFQDSPLWSTYLEEDVIAKDSLGNPIPGEVFWDMQSYQISYTMEWELGLAQQRIDCLLEMIPELKEGGTIHIDAFHSMRPSGVGEPISPYTGITMEEEIATQRKIFRYWREKGLDVTCEAGMYWLRKDPFLGLQAASWHNTSSNFEKEDWLGKPEYFDGLPIALSAYTPMQCEPEVMKDPITLTGLKEQVATRLVPWYLSRNPGLQQNSEYVVTDSLVIAPIGWNKSQMIIYAPNGLNQKLDMTQTAVAGANKLLFSEITLDGLRELDTLQIEEGLLQLQLPEGVLGTLSLID
ncbi:endo-alpha-N-acetylgalactosaminidase family protein [Aureitalea marina]|uniref:Endo-alpha-N-acetylgalactosaminidase domain-containing protein n=1 Tax=Aureitalea marina TaxID=930804 RepID=A0A2S7KRY9_9FLAO|nr:endo-alpha-N-acetylgalactosaminidase family protein [Aureitalea marina]PQB05389.1 hypothetical protein BST85_11185 [Aureitalea marina]